MNCFRFDIFFIFRFALLYDIILGLFVFFFSFIVFFAGLITFLNSDRLYVYLFFF